MCVEAYNLNTTCYHTKYDFVENFFLNKHLEVQYFLNGY